MSVTNDNTIVRASSGGFWANVGIISPWVRFAATLSFIGMQLLFWLVIYPNGNPSEMAKFPMVWRVVVATLTSGLIFCVVMLYGYILADAKRRGMRAVMWLLLAIFIPDMIGVILYFVMRDPLSIPCPNCGHLARGAFTFCPNCGGELLRTCRVCRKKIEPGWKNCAYCGAPLGAQMQRPA